jgi:predicted transcriptional regulator
MKKRVPPTISPKFNPKRFQRAILENQAELQKEILKLRGEITELVERKVTEALGDKIHIIKSTLNEAIIHKELLIEMGVITREQVNKKYDELKAKAAK